MSNTSAYMCRSLTPPMPGVPYPFQASGAGAVGTQQGNEAPGNQLDIGNMDDQGFNFEQANQTQMEWNFSSNPTVFVTPAWDSNLGTIQEDVAKVPSNAGPDSTDHDMDNMEISWDVEDESAEGQA